MALEILNNELPTKITNTVWVHASVIDNKNHPRKFKKDNSGKWLIFSDIKEHDSNWAKVKKATEDGLLGTEAKAATGFFNPNATSVDEKVICVYTYNYQDIDDVFRIEKTLRDIGIEQTLYYKTDSDTLAGQYKIKGAKNISKYISKAKKSYKKFNLNSLNNVGDDKIKILRRIGIKNFDNLLSFDTSKQLVGKGICTESINKLKLAALAQIENKIYKISPNEFPQGELIHFDIETDLSPSFTLRKVWSIAIYHNKKTKHFFANTWNQEKKILKEFLAYIKKIDRPILVSYSGAGFDKNILNYALMRHDLDFEYFQNLNHQDLCTYLKQNYVLPIGSYRLKDVGSFFGYKFKHSYFDGLYVASQYIECQNRGKKLSKNIFSYIHDDVKSMDHILKQIRIWKDIKHLI